MCIPPVNDIPDLHFALREVSGLRRCIEMRDEEELAEELQKLRRGPLLS